MEKIYKNKDLEFAEGMLYDAINDPSINENSRFEKLCNTKTFIDGYIIAGYKEGIQ